MSKIAEQKALEAYPYNRAYTDNDVEYDGNFCNRLPYIEGYEQAEKDLALTWEDIGKIHAHLEDVFKETAKGLHDEWTVMDMYEEVSKRFNEQRKK